MVAQAACFLVEGADVEGAGEYAGGSSPGTEGGYVDWLLGTKRPY
jgi:hypothetical protein